jgi:hypothetical protein
MSDKLREALSKLLDACLLADAHEELSGYVDGSLLDAARAALAAPTPAPADPDSTAMRERLQTHCFLYDDYFSQCSCGWKIHSPSGYTNAWGFWIGHVL